MLSKKMQEQFKRKSPIRRAFEEAKRLETIYGVENVFDFSIGNPGAKAPDKVRESVEQIIQEDSCKIHSYMSDAGYEEVRKKVADYLNRTYGTKLNENNIVMTNGAAGAINVAMYSLVDPDDEIVLMKPYYPGYESFIINWNGKLVAVEPNPEDFQPDFEDLERKLSDRTKMVFVNSPNNPTGAIYTEDTVKKIAEILNRKQKEYGHAIYLLSDEPYRELVYNGSQLPFWTLYYDNTIVAYSFSKSLSLAGERIGYLTIPDEVEESEQLIRAVKIATGMLGFVNAPSFFQKVAGECLDEKIPIEYYRKNKDYLYERLTSLGFSILNPQGAFYMFMKAPKGDEERLLRLAHECHILLVGGTAFHYPGYARVSFCVSFDVIQRSIPAFEKLAEMLQLGRG